MGRKTLNHSDANSNETMNILSELINNRKARLQRAEQRKETAMQDEYAERIQAKEYDGKMYISVDGVPFIEAASVKVGIVEALNNIRQTIIKYKTK